MEDKDIKYINQIEEMIKKNPLSKMPKSIAMIEKEFSKYAYLNSLIEMKRGGHL